MRRLLALLLLLPLAGCGSHGGDDKQITVLAASSLAEAFGNALWRFSTPGLRYQFESLKNVRFFFDGPFEQWAFPTNINRTYRITIDGSLRKTWQRLCGLHLFGAH